MLDESCWTVCLRLCFLTVCDTSEGNGILSWSQKPKGQSLWLYAETWYLQMAALWVCCLPSLCHVLLINLCPAFWTLGWSGTAQWPVLLIFYIENMFSQCIGCECVGFLVNRRTFVNQDLSFQRILVLKITQNILIKHFFFYFLFHINILIV